MPVTIVGAGTLVPSGEFSSPCHLIEAPGLRMLLDMGPGAVHSLARVGRDWSSISHVVFSHYHTDHFAGLPHLLWALRWGLDTPRTTPLQVLGPLGLGSRIQGLTKAFGSYITDPGFPVSYLEFERTSQVQVDGWSLDVHPTPHTEESVCLRVAGDGWAVGYTGDSGPDLNLGHNLAGCDVLIADCAHTDPPRSPMHLSPKSVAAMAGDAAPGVLVLTHLYPPLTPDSASDAVSEAGYTGRVIGATDGLTLSIPCDAGGGGL